MDTDREPKNKRAKRRVSESKIEQISKRAKEQKSLEAMADFDEVFKRLKGILEPYGEQLSVTVNKPGQYYLESSYSEMWKKPLFFGSAKIQKNYVSFYLMPVYMCPELLEEISPALKKRMQGKSCFNFKGVDEDAFAELANLTKKGFERFEKEL